MKRNLLAGRMPWLPLIMLALALCGCRPQSTVASARPPGVSAIVPAPGERLNERLVVIFDAPVTVAGDTQTSPPLRFEPPLFGSFQIGTNHIIFTPSSLPTRAIIEARLNPDQVRVGGQPLPADTPPLILTTFDFKAEQVGILDRSTTATIYGIHFTAPVTPDSLADRLRLVDADNRPVPFTTVPGGPARVARLVVAAQAPPPVRAHIAAGLPEAGDRFHLPLDQQLLVPLPKAVEAAAGTRFAVQEVQLAETGPAFQRIRLRLNQPVAPADLTAHLRVQDLTTTDTQPLAVALVDLPTTAPSRQFMLQIQVPNPRLVHVRLLLDPALRSAAGMPLGADFSRDLQRRTELQVSGFNWQTGGRRGLALNFNLSHSADPDALRRLLTVEPPIDEMQLEPTGPDSFTLNGRFQLDRSYRVTLAAGIPFAGWAQTTAPLRFTAVSPERISAWLHFPAEDRYYLPRAGGASVPLETRGVNEVKLSLHRMFPSNIALALDDIERTWGRGNLIQRWSEPVGEATILTPGRAADPSRVQVALDELTTAPLRGVYALRAETDSNSAARVCLLTDIGLVAHWQRDHLLVFAHNLTTLEPIPNARVTAYSFKNQPLGSAVTGSDGLARLEDFQPNLGQPVVAVVEAGEDYAYVRLSPKPLPSRAARLMDGADPYASEAADAFIHADRELYRPGDTVHLRWTVRRRYGDALAGAPFVLRLLKPNGQPLLERTITLDEFGAAALDLPTQRAYPTGRYQALLLVPGNERAPIGRYSFLLEEFVPNRMQAQLELAQPIWVHGETHAATLEGRHLFGAPAAGRTAALEVNFERGARPDGWPGYRFDNDSTFQPPPLDLGQRPTDEEGRARFEFQYPLPPEVSFPLRARAVGRLFELGGRAVRARAEARFFPSPICLGLAAEQVAGSLQVSVAAVAPDGRPADLASVRVELERQIWSYNVRSYYSHNEPAWSSRFEPVITRELALRDGLTSDSFTLPGDGSYRIKVSSPRTPQYSTLSLFSYGGHTNVHQAAEPVYLRLALDKKEYRVGERARLRIESPFDGSALVVIQGERIRRALTVPLREGHGELELAIESDLHPNVWLEVTAIHPVEPGRPQLYPFASFEMLPLIVRDPARRLTIDIQDLPPAIQSADPLRVTLQTLDQDGRPVAAAVTLAAVDEGIHQVTGYANPDPVGHFARVRRPELNFAHFYDKIAQSFEEPTPGGDGDLASRIGTAPSNWIRTVALWSGVVRTGADGRAEITLPASQFNGRLRLVAVALNATATGVAAADLEVRDPLILQSGLPRVLRPGDRADLMATLFNTTDQPRVAILDWTTSGALALDDGPGSATLELPAHGEATAAIAIRALDRVGAGELHWRARLLGSDGRPIFELAQVDRLPVAESAAYASHWRLARIEPGQSLQFDAAEMVDNELARLELTVGATPLVRLQKPLRGVVDYPYGCAEQTLSRLFGLYLLRRHAGLLGGADTREERIAAMLESGINRLWSMQTPGGGLAFWPGGYEPSPYPSVYALHFLALVRSDRELAVDPILYDQLRDYVVQVARAEGNGSPSALYQRAYAVFALALAGDRRGTELIERFDHLRLPESGRHLLGAALAIATRDPDRVRVYMQQAPTQPWPERELGGTLNTPLRANAVELLTLMHMDGSAERMARLADSLVGALAADRVLSTQENAFLIAALARYYDSLDQDLDAAAATLAWEGGRSRLAGRAIVRRQLSGADARLRVTNDGPVPIYAVAVSRGVPIETSAGPTANGVAVSRRLLDRSGQPLPDGPLRQGVGAVVELTIDVARAVEHLVIADLLPAGVEVINPRLEPDNRSVLNLPHPAASPSRLELRDDRLVLVFDHLPATPAEQKHYFYYAIEPVTSGSFQHPPLAAEAMYDATINGASAPGRVDVVRPDP